MTQIIILDFALYPASLVNQVYLLKDARITTSN